MMPQTGSEKTWKWNWAKAPLLWLGSRAHSALALVAAIVAVVGTELEWFTSTKDLTAVTLGVLTVVALALLIERGLPLSIQKDLRNLGDSVGQARGDIAALHTGSAYHVLEDKSAWEIEKRGEISKVVRTKKLRFAQDGVITLLDYAGGDGTGRSEYSRGTPVKDFKLDGRDFRLLLLERFYNRGDELDFEVRRTAKDRFPRATERVRIEARHVIFVLRLSVRWSSERLPTAVRLRTRTPTGQTTTTIVTGEVKTDSAGCKEYSVAVNEPELGGETAIEWDW